VRHEITHSAEEESKRRNCYVLFALPPSHPTAPPVFSLRVGPHQKTATTSGREEGWRKREPHDLRKSFSFLSLSPKKNWHVPQPTPHFFSIFDNSSRNGLVPPFFHPFRPYTDIYIHHPPPAYTLYRQKQCVCVCVYTIYQRATSFLSRHSPGDALSLRTFFCVCLSPSSSLLSQLVLVLVAVLPLLLLLLLLVGSCHHHHFLFFF
jgi:hypothetical protein